MKVFIEQQKFTQPLLIIILSIVIIIAGYSTFKELDQITTGSLTEKLSALSGLIIVLLVVFFFTILKLKTRIDEKGINYQFFPFHLKARLIPWKEIEKCNLRKYNALTEFRGWGYKVNMTWQNGKAYTTKGNQGLQLKLKSGKKILFGTQKKDELQRVLDTYQHKITNG
jgi:hypothetical protein